MSYLEWKTQELAEFRDKLRLMGFTPNAAGNFSLLVEQLMDEARDIEDEHDPT